MDYEDDEDDDFEDVSYNVVDESKEWQCLFCTYLNSLEVEICDMCSKSRRSVASSRAEEDSEFVSGNSQIDEPETEDDNEVDDDEEDDVEDEVQGAKVHCPKCTLLNPADLNICTVCGASLHKAPINVKSRNGGLQQPHPNQRPQSSASGQSRQSKSSQRSYR